MDNLRMRTKINITEYPYSDDFTDPIIIKTFNNFVEKFMEISQKIDYLTLRTNYQKHILMDIVSSKHSLKEDIPAKEIVEKLRINGIYYNNQYLFGEKYIRDKYEYLKLINMNMPKKIEKPIENKPKFEKDLIDFW